MALDVSALKEQIEKEKESLKSVDENIRKITGRDPNEPRQINDTRRISSGSASRGQDLSTTSFRRRRTVDSENVDEPSQPPRKRPAVFSRLGSSNGGRRVSISKTTRDQKKEDDEEEEDEEAGAKPAVQSSVVSTAKKITKDQLISAQNVGEKGRARNKRMFGMLLGTLAKFNASSPGRQSKQALKQKEVENRLEEETAQERRKLASERKTLFNERRMQQRRIHLMEEKIALANELEEWVKEWEKKSEFIMTKSSPSIFFKPTEWSPKMQRALQESKERIKELIEKHKESVAETMSAYDAEIKLLENKQDNGKGVENGEGMHSSGSHNKGGKIEPEPEEEMDLDSMGPQVDIKVEMDDGDQNVDHGNDKIEPSDVPNQSIDSQDEDVANDEKDSIPGENNTMEDEAVAEADISMEEVKQNVDNETVSSEAVAEKKVQSENESATDVDTTREAGHNISVSDDKKSASVSEENNAGEVIVNAQQNNTEKGVAASEKKSVSKEDSGSSSSGSESSESEQEKPSVSKTDERIIVRSDKKVSPGTSNLGGKKPSEPVKHKVIKKRQPSSGEESSSSSSSDSDRPVNKDKARKLSQRSTQRGRDHRRAKSSSSSDSSSDDDDRRRTSSRNRRGNSRSRRDRPRHDHKSSRRRSRDRSRSRSRDRYYSRRDRRRR